MGNKKLLKYYLFTGAKYLFQDSENDFGVFDFTPQSLCNWDDRCKIYLHPLSRLTEPILDGNTPIDWLEEKYFTLDLHKQCKRILEDERWINHCDWILIQHLFEWNFDVFGLIEKGLAIEKQPLKQ